MNTCSWRPSTVTLYDGTQVSSDSEAWRHECEARAIIAMPGKAARRALMRGMIDEQGKHRDGILQQRGEAAVKRLEATIMAIWNAGRER
jgi:hypothetical protein